jgi:hypothetical protein
MDAKYQIVGKLNAIDQLNIARKLSPALPLLDAVVAKENSGKDKGVLITMSLGMLSDESSKYVLEKCLALAVRHQDSGLPARIMTNGNLMFDDITLRDLTDITAAVIEENLGDFLTTALPDLIAE